MRRAALAGAATLCVAVILTWAVRMGSQVWSTAQITRGKGLYDSHCASCHGKKLQGQPDWKSPLANGRMPAPPHDGSGHSWHHSDEALIGITKFGLKPYVNAAYESDMPAFGATLSDEDIAAVWAYIKSTWPDRQRAYQVQITRQDAD